jgi:hypothetical protein
MGVKLWFGFGGSQMKAQLFVCPVENGQRQGRGWVWFAGAFCAMNRFYLLHEDCVWRLIVVDRYLYEALPYHPPTCCGAPIVALAQPSS